MTSELNIRIQEMDFDLAHEYAELRQQARAAGAIVTFTGLVREIESSGDDTTRIDSMSLEHYEGMTQVLLKEIVEQACAQWRLLAVRVIHRIGKLLPGEQIVLVGVAAAHRGEAFEAAQFVMDYLKTRATLWKKISRDGDERWLDSKESDQDAASRWDHK